MGFFFLRVCLQMIDKLLSRLRALSHTVSPASQDVTISPLPKGCLLLPDLWTDPLHNGGEHQDTLWASGSFYGKSFASLFSVLSAASLANNLGLTLYVYSLRIPGFSPMRLPKTTPVSEFTSIHASRTSGLLIIVLGLTSHPINLSLERREADKYEALETCFIHMWLYHQ